MNGKRREKDTDELTGDSVWSCGRCWIHGDAESVEVAPVAVLEDIRRLLRANPNAMASDLAAEVEQVLSGVSLARDANYQRGYANGYQAGRRNDSMTKAVPHV